RFKEAECPAEFICSSLMDVPLADASVDVIFSEGVLHHTDSTKEALCALSRLLRPGGTFLFYVYAKKAITREFVDDHIRDQLKGMSNDEAWEALYPLTKLGIALGELNVTLDVPDDIPMLGIKKGPMPLQRFLYWNFFKAFYSPELDLEEMNHLNFDWYRPLNCHRHSKEEVLDFCQAAGLKAERVHVEEAGITVCARKTA
ncbi:MAG: class I SAM-dependent methyltransferase, partial [Chlamydiia bacterium]|nr:class I SAM-dependent methyltransferase [Chlamydiia bacterium]